MKRRPTRAVGPSALGTMNQQPARNRQFGQEAASPGAASLSAGTPEADLARVVTFLGDLSLELDTALDPTTPIPIVGPTDGSMVVDAIVTQSIAIPEAAQRRNLVRIFARRAPRRR